MASIYKRTRSYPIPSGAKITERKRKATHEELRADPTRPTIIERYASWTDGKGRQRRGLLDDTSGRVTVEATTYTIAYWLNGERVEVNSDTPDRDAAQQLANKLETEAMLRARGIIDATQERHATQARRPIEEHVADFERFLLGKDNTVRHVAETVARVRAVIERSQSATVKDLSPSSVQGIILAMRNGGSGLATCNAYLGAIKFFTRWLWRDKRTIDDALITLRAFNADTDKRHERRELTPEELAVLLPFVEGNATPNFSLTGPDRAMLYRLALGTGFRANELRALTPASFDLTADPPTVTVEAKQSKRRRQDVQPIRRDLAELLRDWLAGRPHDQRPFGRLPKHTSRMLQHDLRAARRQWITSAPAGKQREQREQSDFLRYRDAAGRVVDFHATRHTYISGIVAGGASVKVAQELARHSTPTLTIGRYSHTRLHDLTGALDTLPGKKPAYDDRQSLRATGTNNLGAKNPEQLDRGGSLLPANRQQFPANRQQSSGEMVPFAAERGEWNADCRGGETTREDGPQVLVLSVLGGDKTPTGGTWQGAEGTGLEPATPCGAPEFQSGS